MKSMNQFIIHFSKDNNNPSCPVEKWELFKYKVRKITRKYASKKCQVQKMYVSNLQYDLSELTSLQEKAINVEVELSLVMHELKQILASKEIAAVFRSMVRTWRKMFKLFSQSRKIKSAE